MNDNIESIVDLLVRRQPRMHVGDEQAYKRAVIRMTLEYVMSMFNYADVRTYSADYRKVFVEWEKDILAAIDGEMKDDHA